MSDVSLSASGGRTDLEDCRHCGIAFRRTKEESEFCCSGCRFVFHLLHKRGLDEFYRYGQKRVPAAGYVFHERDLTWILELQKEAEKSGGRMAEATADVQGISCAACVWLLEAVFMEHSGSVSCTVDSSTGSIKWRWLSGQCDLAEYARDVQRFGYLLGPVQNGRTSSLRSLTRKLGICAALALNAMLFALPRYLGIDSDDALSALFDLITFIVASLSIVIGGSCFFRRAWVALRAGELHIDLPISLGLLFAYTGSVAAWMWDQHNLNYFDFVSIFTFLMLLGRWTQERSIEANRRRLLGYRLTPGFVNVLRDGLESREESTVLRPGDRFRVERNQVVPVRSRLLDRASTFALNWISGEPAPRRFHAGAIVPSGARNLEDDSPLFEALEEWSSSQLSSLLRIHSDRKWRNAGLHGVIRIYLGVVLCLAALGFLGWGVAGGNWFRALQVMISVLVVSCPCAIGVALPLLDDLAALAMQQYGVFLRDGSLWDRLKRVSCLLFDKTGTITLETLRLKEPEVLRSLAPKTKGYLLRLVERSLHPAAVCLREELLAAGVEAEAGGASVQEIAGMGLEWLSPVGMWRLGRASWAGKQDGGRGSVLALEGTVIAEFCFHEQLRPDAAEQVSQFQTAGKSVYLLSGDSPGRVEALGRTLGLPPGHAIGGLKPEDKAALVLGRWRDNSLMLGDGANDSLAFDAALCRGTPAVDAGLLEHKADFYLMGRGLGGLGALFHACHIRSRTHVAVMAFALTYNATAVGVSLAGMMNPLVAAIIMPLSSLASIGIVFLRFGPFFTSHQSNR